MKIGDRVKTETATGTIRGFEPERETIARIGKFDEARQFVRVFLDSPHLYLASIPRDNLKCDNS
jgi:hypothetical protein